MVPIDARSLAMKTRIRRFVAIAMFAVVGAALGQGKAHGPFTAKDWTELRSAHPAVSALDLLIPESAAALGGDRRVSPPGIQRERRRISIRSIRNRTAG